MDLATTADVEPVHFDHGSWMFATTSFIMFIVVAKGKGIISIHVIRGTADVVQL